MEADVLLRGLKELRHQWLGQPDSFLLETDVNLDGAVLGLIDQKLGFLRQVAHAPSPFSSLSSSAICQHKYPFEIFKSYCQTLHSQEIALKMGFSGMGLI